MATVMTRETRNFEDVPVFCYGIDADSYEEAYALATRMFTEDKEEYLDSIGLGSGREFLEDMRRWRFEDAKDFSFEEQDEGARLFQEWKKKLPVEYKDEFEKIDNLLKHRARLFAEAADIDKQKSIKWFFCSKDKVDKDKRKLKEPIWTERFRVEDEINSIVEKIWQ